MGPGFWLVTAPASWAAGGCVSVLSRSLGASFLAAAVIGLIVCGIAASFIQHLINQFVAPSDRT